MTEKRYEELAEAAIRARKAAYAPYSGFCVGAALLCGDGKIRTGCNVENAAYPAGICAERCAVFKAVSEGCREFEALAVCGARRDADESGRFPECPPCGGCRQVMREFCDPKEMRVLLARTPEDYREMTLEELLPESFGPEDLARG
jgi:cytidine deaminase